MKNTVLLLPRRDTFRRFACTLEIFDMKWLTQDSHSKEDSEAETSNALPRLNHQLSVSDKYYKTEIFPA